MHDTPLASVAATWTAAQVWAAAARACRINQGQYLRNDEWLHDDRAPNGAVPGRRASKSIIKDSLQNLDLLEDIDWEDGRAARLYFQRLYTFKVLKDNINGFESRLVECITQENFTAHNSTEFTVIASQLPRWKNHIVEEEMLQGTITTPMATIGERVSRDITVVRTIWSEKYQMNFITARTDCNHVVFFAFKEGMPRGRICRINGTVKAHRTDSTQLNRVKVFDL